MNMTRPTPTDDSVARLRVAGDYAAIKALFANDGWLRARVAQGGYDGYLADMQIAWDVAAEQLLRQAETGEEPTAALDLMRYTLIWSGIHMAVNYFAPGLIARAVATGLWTPARAISAAGLSWEPMRAFDVYAALLEHGGLSGEDAATVYRLMMQAAEAIDCEGSRAQAFERAAKYADPAAQTQALETALDAALKAADRPDYPTDFALRQLAQELPETLLDRAVAGTRALHNHNARAWVLTMLARRLPERCAALIDDALAAVPDIVDATAQGMDDVLRANAIAQMADLLDGEQVTRAFEIGLTLVDEGRNWLPRAVAPLVDRLDAAQRARALDAVLLVEDDWGRKDGLLALVRHAQGETQQRAFQALLMIRHGEARDVIRQTLAAVIDPALSESGGAFAAQIDDAEQKAWALEVLRTLPAADAPPEAADANMPSVDEQFAQALNIRWEEDRFPVLERLLSQLSPEQIRIVLEDAHASVSDAGTRDWLIGEIAAYADGEVLAALFERAVTPWQMLADCSVLLNWAGKLGEPFSAEAMAYIESRLTPRLQSSTRILLLKRLLPHLTGAAKHSTRSAEALATALTNDYPPGRARDLIDVIDVLDEADRAAAFEALYASVMSYPEFAPSPDAAQYPLAANNEDQKIERVQHASALLNPIQDERRVHLVARIVDLTLTLNNRVWVVSFLKQVAALLDSDQLARALTTVNAWDDSDERAAALRALRPYLSKAQVSDLPPDPAEGVGSYREFRRRLDLARNANTDERPELLEQALAAGKQLQKLGERRIAFIHLAQAGVPKALDTLMESVSYMDEDSRWQILLQLYPLLSDQADVRRMIWRGIITQFEQMRSGSREFVFDWDHWYQPWTQLQSLMTAELHARIGLLVLEIVRDWRWA